jgi:hypothetical protein
MSSSKGGRVLLQAIKRQLKAQKIQQQKQNKQ